MNNTINFLAIANNYYNTHKLMGLLLLWLVFEPVRCCRAGVLDCPLHCTII